MKYVYVAGIIIAVIFIYILLAAEQPAITSIVASANASGNWTGFEETQNAINAFPFYMWLIPGAVGAIGIVIALRSGGGSSQ